MRLNAINMDSYHTGKLEISGQKVYEGRSIGCKNELSTERSNFGEVWRVAGTGWENTGQSYHGETREMGSFRKKRHR